MVLVRATALDDWQAMRDIRLEALRDAPDAFASTYARETAFEPDEWHRRATRDGSFLAFIPGLTAPAGLVGGFEQEAGVAELVSMFVRPRARGHGVAAWARNRNATSVHLWVSETNKPAIRLYERCGFTVTSERQPLPSNPALGEVGMTRPL
jgi:GNAT superfamily N-acetyltransferase